MRIKDEVHFVIGVFDILCGIVCLIAGIYLHRGAKTAIAFAPIIFGVALLVQSIETKAERQRRKEELQAMAKMLGWDKEDWKSHEKE